MILAIKVKCVECGGRYYIGPAEVDAMLPEDIQPGEAFPIRCPLCNEGQYAVLPKRK